MAGGKVTSPTGTAPDRSVYYPGTEELGPDEIRVIALGTGMPTPRPFQAAACFLMELGNGDKFIFDIGDGSVERMFALQIPTAFLDKVFIGHLHSDHFGALADLWIGGVIGNRIKPLRVWGPSGHKPEFGTAYAMEHLTTDIDIALAAAAVPGEHLLHVLHRISGPKLGLVAVGSPDP